MTTNRQQVKEAFGALQMFTLGTILLLGACLALPIQTMSVPLYQFNTPTFDLALWGIEIALYAGLSWLFSRKWTGALVGLLIGLVTRLLANLLICVLLNVPLAQLVNPQQPNVVFHGLAIVISLLAMLLSFRALLASLGVSIALPAPAAVAKSARFSFESQPLPPPRPATPAKVPLVLDDETASAPTDGEPPTHLHPPEDFTPVFPREDAAGTINLSAGVILESVPEAKTILSPSYQLSIRLSLIVPQLPRATIWLTWRQIFEKGVPPMANVETAKLEPVFLNRWVRIPARYYVTQVPREYFQTAKASPGWMKLPAVEQEANISFTS